MGQGLDTGLIGEIRGHGDGRPLVRDHLEPSQRIAEDGRTGQQHRPRTQIETLEQTAEQTEVVKDRHPGNDDGALVQAHRLGAVSEIRFHIAVVDHHTARIGRGS